VQQQQLQHQHHLAQLQQYPQQQQQQQLLAGALFQVLTSKKRLEAFKVAYVLKYILCKTPWV